MQGKNIGQLFSQQAATAFPKKQENIFCNSKIFKKLKMKGSTVMKVEFVVSKPIPTAAQLRKRRVYTVCCWILRGLLVLTTILFTWITCWGCGLGWISRARAGSNWPIEFAGYGQMLLVGSGLLTLGTVLVLLCRKNWLNWAAAGSATAGVTLAMLALYRVTAYASEHSFYSRLMEMPAATLYRLQLLPVLVPYVCVVVSGLLQFFSAEAVQRRQEKKRQDSAKAPSVL